MTNKLTPKMIRKAVKRLEKYETKSNGNGLIEIEIESPRELLDIIEGIKNKLYILDIKGDVKVRGKL